MHSGVLVGWFVWIGLRLNAQIVIATKCWKQCNFYAVPWSNTLGRCYRNVRTLRYGLIGTYMACANIHCNSQSHIYGTAFDYSLGYLLALEWCV